MNKNIENLKWRYAVKKFDENKSLSNEQIRIIKEAFNLTATSYGLQPVKMVILQNKEIQQQLVAHSWNQQQIAQASHVLVFCVEENISDAFIANYFTLVKNIRNTPGEILNPFKDFLSKDIQEKSPEVIFQWNKNQAYLAMGNLLTICANEKIDACPMEGFTPEKYDEILNLKAQNLKSVLVMPIGYRAEDDYMKDLKKVRKNTEDVVIEIN